MTRRRTIISHWIALPALLITTLSICLSWFASEALAQRLLGGVEIGGSGAKGFIYRLDGEQITLLKDGRINSNQQPKTGPREPVVYGGVGVVSALSENNLAGSVIEVIAAQVKDIIAAQKARGIVDADIFLVGSSSVEKIVNADELIDAIKAASSHTLVFISPEQEAAFGLLDAVSEDTTRPHPLENSIAVDVGAGNLKAAYAERGELHPFEIPFGTDNVLQLDNGDGGSCGGWKADSCFLQAYFTGAAEQGIRTQPRLRDRQVYPNVYLSGGTAWAVSRLMRLNESLQPYSTLTYGDFLSALKKVDTLEIDLANAVKSLRQKQVRNNISASDLAAMTKQAEQVAAYYGKRKKMLKGGIALYLWFFELAGRNTKADTYWELNRQGDWLRHYILHRKGLVKAFSIPEYRPTISRRSHDIER